jgi:hypothetical protein
MTEHRGDSRWPLRRRDPLAAAATAPVIGHCLFHPDVTYSGTLLEVREWFAGHAAIEHPGGRACALHVTTGADDPRNGQR